MAVKAPLPFRHAERGEPGIPLIDFVNAAVAGDRQRRQRMLALIHEWDYLTDTLGHRPSVAEYAEHWKVSRSTVYTVLDEFERLFPGQEDPTGICEEIWDGVKAQQDEDGLFFVDLERVRVVVSSPAASG